MSSSTKIHPTGKFAVFDLPDVTVNKHARKEDHKKRANKESGARIDTANKLIGGAFNPKNASCVSYQEERISLFEEIRKENEANAQQKPSKSISITLPNGDVKEGSLFVTTAMDIAMGISKGLADSIIVAVILCCSND